MNRQHTFNRGLDQEFVYQLNEMYDQPGNWWRGLVDAQAEDEDLFIAIREEYLNIYYQGSSLLRLQRHGGRIVGKIHYKYLLHPQALGSDPYVKVEAIDGRACLPEEKSLFMKDLSDLANLKKAVRLYAKVEKTGVHEIIRANRRHVLDTEVGLSSESIDSAKYVDFAALEEDGKKIRIVFYEAKRFSDGRISAKGEADPPVICQIKDYEHLLEANREALICSYHRVCRNLAGLKGLTRGKYQTRQEMLQAIADEPKTLCIDTKPRLVVFGYDRDQQKGKWKEYREKLEKKLGKCRVLSKGSPRNIKLA